MRDREERYTHERLVKCRNFSRAFCIVVHFSSLGIQIYGVHTHNMRAHGVKQKPPVCARMCADHEYVWVFLRKMRVLFAPRNLVCACEIKGCRPLVLSSSPSVAHTCLFPPFLSLARVRSLFLPLFIPSYVDYTTCPSSHTPPPSFLTTTVRNVYQQIRQ